jgi:hypothetical protein
MSVGASHDGAREAREGVVKQRPYIEVAELPALSHLPVADRRRGLSGFAAVPLESDSV